MTVRFPYNATSVLRLAYIGTDEELRQRLRRVVFEDSGISITVEQLQEEFGISDPAALRRYGQFREACGRTFSTTTSRVILRTRTRHGQCCWKQPSEFWIFSRMSILSHSAAQACSPRDSVRTPGSRSRPSSQKGMWPISKQSCGRPGRIFRPANLAKLDNEILTALLADTAGWWVASSQPLHNNKA